MSESDVEHVRQHIKVYVTVFVALAVLTVVTVGISYLHLPTGFAITLAMVVATVKAGLVAGYFMHLISEEKVILWVLLLCAAFLFVLFILPLGTQIGNGPLWPL
ncbi:MAG: cytochrome C oxidase subunit IV family protein [Myxococcales bacterium]|nr:cytochrome C oxidase subunit IV family protein [Myxococcales bacterium]